MGLTHAAPLYNLHYFVQYQTGRADPDGSGAESFGAEFLFESPNQ